MIITDSDGEISKKMHRVTKFRDISLVSCSKEEQHNMLDREVIGTCLFVWADRDNMASSNAKRWKLSRRGWGKMWKNNYLHYQRN